MPYPNEHACRMNNPAKYVKFSRNNDVQPNVIIGYTKDGKSEVQSYRFPVKDWDERKARNYCKQKGGVFEPALKKGAEDMYEIELATNSKEKWYLVIPRGTYQHQEYGELDFGDSFFEEMLQNFKNNVLGNTKPFIDQDHDQRGAAGWVNDMKYNEEGMWAKIEWTPVGVDLIKNKIYKYFSPAYGDYQDPKTGKMYHNVFRGGALTNIPFLKELPEIELKESRAKGLINVKIFNETGGKIKMEKLIEFLKEQFKDELNIEGEELEEKAIELLKAVFEEKANNEQALNEIKAEKEELEKKLKDTEAKLSEKDKKEMKENEVIKQLTEKVVNLEMEKVIGKAMSEGKILPEKREFWEKQYKNNPEATKEIIDNLPVVLEFKEKANVTPRKGGIELDEETKEAAKKFGLTEEDFKKYGEEV